MTVGKTRLDLFSLNSYYSPSFAHTAKLLPELLIQASACAVESA
jgi:hypothetical protein